MTATAQSEATLDGGVWRIVHRVVLPTDGETDTLPLYVDFDAAPRGLNDEARTANKTVPAAAVAPSSQQRPDFIVGRRQVRLPAHQRVSFGTYFNAFPASYWRAHTNVQTVRLTVELDAAATVIVYRSNARGTANRVEGIHSDNGGTLNVELPITQFGDGGWYWFDLVTHGNEVELLGAAWSVPQRAGSIPGTATFAITTFNKPDYCVRNMKILASSPELLEVMDRLIITDQGTQKVRNQDGYEEAAAALGSRFRLIEQGNIGGTGGFARGMLETVEEGVSDYCMLLDDDVVIETEGVLRAIQFADFTRNPTIVGGHMFNLYERAVLHNFGESVNEWRFTWGSSENTRQGHDFSESNLRTTPWMHRRVEVDTNGWWMSLVPTGIIGQTGLPLPLFIKWDDAEFSIRAKKHGFQTVTLPGAAVWHMPWTEKDDTIDWQAYFHQRNRWVCAMIHSPYKLGGNLMKQSFAGDIRHLLSLQYSTVQLRLEALEDVLKGPAHLHSTIHTKLPEIHRHRSKFTDARVTKDVAAFPAVKRLKPPRRGIQPSAPRTLAGAARKSVTGALRQITSVRPEAREHPEAVVPAMDARWWRLAQLDSALVSSADGTGASWYQRDDATFRSMILRSIRLHRQLLLNWNMLADDYRTQLPDITSPQAWTETFAAVTPQPATRPRPRKKKQ